MPVGSLEILQLCVLEANTDWGVQGHLEEHFMGLLWIGWIYVNWAAVLDEAAGPCAQKLSCGPTAVSEAERSVQARPKRLCFTVCFNLRPQLCRYFYFSD